MTYIALGLWGILMIAAAFYTQRARHPDAKPLAAYLIFVTLFSAVAFFLFGAFTFLLEASGRTGLLGTWPGAVAMLVAVFVPAFFIGRWQLKKPPRRPRLP